MAPALRMTRIIKLEATIFFWRFVWLGPAVRVTDRAGLEGSEDATRTMPGSSTKVVCPSW
jgi:hypothetical protein